MKRFKLKRGSEKLFTMLNNKQMKDNKKTIFCDYVVVNEQNLNILKKKLSSIIKNYV